MQLVDGDLLDALKDFSVAVWSDCRLPGAMRTELAALYHNTVRQAIAKAEARSCDAAPQTMAAGKRQVVVFASGGVTLSVATKGFPCEIDCVVVDYDDRHRRDEDISPADFEREFLGCTREEWEKSGAQYIW